MNNSIFIENNKATLTGTVATRPVFSHEVYDENFYLFTLEVPRLSDTKDYIQITISEKLLCAISLDIGLNVKINGQFRSYNNFSNIGNKLVLTVFVKDIEILDFDSELQETENPNQIFLKGFICKEPIYRTTPFGREIADLLIAVNRSYNKSDYIPCIAWGRNAKYASSLTVGDGVSIYGRIQSRNYQKKITEDEIENKTAYEISISKIDQNKPLEAVHHDLAY